MITETIVKELGFPIGHLLHEGYQVKCAGDVNGNQHLIVTLGAHLPGKVAHAIGNPEFTDDLWTIDEANKSIDWNNPICAVCGAKLVR